MQKYGKWFQTTLIAIITLGILTAIVLILLTPKQTIAPNFNETSETITPNTPLPSSSTTIFFAGDIMLSREVENKMIGAQDFTLPFQKIAEFSAASDIAFANLESPFSDKASISENRMVFRAPLAAIEGLNLGGFDVLSTANNHALDQGRYGLEKTYSWLKEHGILPSGTHPEAITQVDNVIERNGILFAFLSYTYSAANLGGDSNPLVGNFNDIERMKQDLLEVRGHYADVVIVSMHAGTEYTREPHDKQKAFARAAIDAGADLVIGHHPHWVQTVEQYQGRWIFYSLGNFVFDQMWSQDTQEGITVLATYREQELVKLEVNPIVIDNYCCPRWANKAEKESILGKINLTTSVLMDNN